MAKDPESLGDLLKDLTKRFDVPIGALSEVSEPVQPLTTGNLAIDYLTGIGGLPLGRSVELYGLPSSGKTTTALQAAAKLQQKLIRDRSDEFILYLDYEHALDGEYAANLGLDVEHPSFLVMQPGYMEQGAEPALKLVGTGKCRLVIWDSVASMAPLSRIEGDFDQRTAAMNKARLMSGLLLQLTPLLAKHNCCSVFINHLMESIDMGGRPGMPPKVDTPGGKALKFYTSIRLEYRQIKNAKAKTVDPLANADTDQAVATHVKVKVVKNKVGKPFREAEVRVRYGQGFDDFWSAKQVLVAHRKIIAGNAGLFYFDPSKIPSLVHDDLDRSGTGRPNVRGEAALLAFADTHPGWRAQAIKEATALLEEHGDAALIRDIEPDTVADLGPTIFDNEGA